MLTKTLGALALFFSCNTLYCPFMPNTRGLQGKTNSVSELNENPLLRPSLYKQESTAQLKEALASKKYDPNALESETYLSPLAHALSAPTPVALILLITAGANPNKPYQQGALAMTPLMGAIEKKKVEHVEALLAAGANPNYGNTRSYPLLSAVYFGNWMWNDDSQSKLKIIGLLLRFGANPLITHDTHMPLCKQIIHDFLMHSGSKNSELLGAWRCVGRAFVKYKIVKHIFSKTLSLPIEIAENILRFVDFELEGSSPSLTTPGTNS